MPEIEKVAFKSDTQIVRNYLEWQQAINGGGQTVEQHRRLVQEDRPFPSITDALAALTRIEEAHRG